MEKEKKWNYDEFLLKEYIRVYVYNFLLKHIALQKNWRMEN